MAEALVDVRGLTVRFRRRRGLSLAPAPTFRAVAEATLAVGRREVVGLVGESGSGKTTLGRTVLRLYEPAEGTIAFEGQDITHLRERELRAVWRRMALVFQDPLSSLNPRHSIGAALGTPLRLSGVARAEVAGRVAEALRRVGLPAEAMGRYPHELSGGQLQRAALARALMLGPAFVVADEAVSKLDVSVRSQILNLFRDLQDALDVSFLFITHDLHVARFVCDRVAVMFFGRIVESAPVAELFRAPRHPYTRALLATLEPGAPVSGQRGAVDQDAPGCVYRGQCPRALPRCAEAHPATEIMGDAHVLACYNPG
jgi:oligopeptide/dipeptide ABC transporter ATP-binding protein